MKKLFVYYSLNGNGDYVATIMEKYGYDILKIETKEKWPTNFTLQILKGGFLASINAKSKLKTSVTKIDKYTKIVIGTPIWNKRISSPINTVIDGLDKPFDLICYSGSGLAQKVKSQLKDKKLEKLTVLIEPLKNKADIKKTLEKEYK